MILAQSPIPSTSLLSVENFSQRISLIRKVRKCRYKQKIVKGDQLIIMSLSIVKDL